MHSKIFSILVICTTLFAEQSLLSNLKKQEIDLDRQNANTQADKLQNDWIAPVVASHTHSKSNQMSTKYLSSQVSQIGITQPIFKSGGIYYAIKYADATRDYLNTSVDIKEKELVSNAISIIYNINKIDLQIAKQKYLLANANIDVIKKDELFGKGLLDSSELDNAILSRNNAQTSLITLKEQREEQIKAFELLSDMDYQKVELKILSLPSRDEYLDNIKIIQQSADIRQKEYMRNMTVADQLFTVALDVRFAKSYAEGSLPNYPDDTAYYGATVSIPIGDINAGKKVELKRLELLKSRLSLEQIKKELEDTYKTSTKKLELLDDKIDISNKDYELYSSLLKDIQDKYSVGLATQYDVDILQNSKNIKELDKRIYFIDRQLLLLELYSTMNTKLL